MVKCRFDGLPLKNVFVDLGFSPPSNSFLDPEKLNHTEKYFPLKVYVSERTFLVQIPEHKSAREIFSKNYAYFSSYSKTWVDHARLYVSNIINRLDLNFNSFVVEIASNDGYLLQFMNEQKIPCIGIEPALNTVKVAREKGIETINDYFTLESSKKLSSKKGKADLIIGNNVFAHIPNVNDFVAGLKNLLGDKGTITLEFPHLLQLMENNQFDTIYHEHFWYFSLFSSKIVFERHNLKIYDVEELPTHGGSLRVYLTHLNNNVSISPNVQAVLEKEEIFGLKKIECYQSFQEQCLKVKLDLLEFLLSCKKENKKVCAYGAAAKGNTLLNYCCIKSDLINFVVDASPHKQGRYLPGSHIEIKSPQSIKDAKPDYLLILPWNIKDEIMSDHIYIKEWGAKFIIPIPSLEII